MSKFTVHDNKVYASTNEYVRFAIEVMDSAYATADHSAIAKWYDRLLPIELKEMGYLPAREMMKEWINIFFSNQSRGGLIPTKARETARRRWDTAQLAWVHDLEPTNDSRWTGLLDGMYVSKIGMMRRIHDFLAWFPDDPPVPDPGSPLLTERCCSWADAFMKANEGSQVYGHRYHATSWSLYNFVHTGPPEKPDWMSKEDYENPKNIFAFFQAQPPPPGTVLDGQFWDAFNLVMRFTFEGMPDSWWAMAFEYGNVAQGFVHLSKVLGTKSSPHCDAAEYATFAQTINEGLWNSRLNHSTYLMPSTVTPVGPLPGDQANASGQFKYMHDTDCLYWARALFEAYEIGMDPANPVQATLQPDQSDDLKCRQTFVRPENRLACRTGLRRSKVADFLSSHDFPEKYLGMALGLTIDWIRYGWDVKFKQFRRKIYHDGSPWLTRLNGDGKWNTLYILLEAYRFTHDKFYLEVFDQAWKTLWKVAQSPTMNGLFPEAIWDGGLPSEPQEVKRAQEQEFFLDLSIKAYFATKKPDYLTYAETIAENLMTEKMPNDVPYFKAVNGVISGALLRLARAKGTLHRIDMGFSDVNVASLTFTQNGSSVGVNVNLLGQPGAVVYMDTGTYEAVKHFADNTTSNSITLHVTKDETVVL